MPAPLPPDLARLLHDLRGPLNSLTMHTELLARAGGPGAAVEDSARTVVEQLARLSAMLTDAFAVAALELGRLEPVDLRTVAEAARARAGAPVSLAEGPWPTVTGDTALLTLALEHLLCNAVEAGGGERPPLVRAVVEGGEVRLEVRDWGRGLRNTDPKVVIRPWHSSKPGHRGLGLVTVERVARLHGGAVRFAAVADGALVTLALPVR
jgi:signal transduction histidine kinase